MMRRPALYLSLCLVANAASGANRKDFSSQGFATKPTKVWTEPSAKFGSPLAEVEPGVELEVLTYSTTRSWAKVRLPSGREGWIPVMHTSFAEPRKRSDGEGSRGLASADESIPQGIEESGGNRGPAGIGAGLARRKPGQASSSELALQARLEYANELSRATASGLGAGVALGYRLADKWWIGGGLDYQFFKEGARDSTMRSSRSTNKFLPYVFGEFASGGFALELGTGVEFDMTSIQTFDLATGSLLQSGSDTSSSAAIKLSPRYGFQVSESLRLTTHLLYKLTIDLGSGTGSNFVVDAAASRLQHVLGVGLGLSFPL